RRPNARRITSTLSFSCRYCKHSSRREAGLHPSARVRFARISGAFGVDRQPTRTYIVEMVSAKGHPTDLHGADVDKLVRATVNSTYKGDIAAATLAECLLQEDAGDWLVHVATFFTDVSPALVLAFAESHGISKIKLARTYSIMKAKSGELSLDLEAVLEP